MPIWILLAGVGLVALLAARANAAPGVMSLPGAPNEPVTGPRPFADLPGDVGGTPYREIVVAPISGSEYTVDVFPPNSKDRVFVVAQLSKWAGPQGIKADPFVNWIRFYRDRQTGERELQRAYAKTPSQEDDERVVAVMQADWELA